MIGSSVLQCRAVFAFNQLPQARPLTEMVANVLSVNIFQQVQYSKNLGQVSACFNTNIVTTAPQKLPRVNKSHAETSGKI